jgi:hypothetical protein
VGEGDLDHKWEIRSLFNLPSAPKHEF